MCDCVVCPRCFPVVRLKFMSLLINVLCQTKNVFPEVLLKDKSILVAQILCCGVMAGVCHLSCFTATYCLLLLYIL